MLEVARNVVDEERVSLKVMTYPSGISQMGLVNFMDDYFPIIHFKDQTTNLK
ncbi:MAG: hypothetical protein SNF73_07235 [Rikenellaceae bacterium]